MRIRFTKMHGQGNDFVVIDGFTRPVTLTPETVKAIASRHFGIGCDQVLLVEPPSDSANDFRYRIWNADGGEVEQCGNGARCFARFVRDQGLTDRDVLRVETAAGIISPRLLPSGEVEVDMGAPRFRLEDIPFRGTGAGPLHAIDLGSATVSVAVVSMGNPHAVQFVDDVESAPVTTLGPLIERHPAFPARVNAGFAQVVSRGHIRLRVWERGAGETLACGTGACAAVVSGIRLGLLDAEVRVSARGGDLYVRWDGKPARDLAPPPPVMMRGGTARVFEGEIDLDALNPPPENSPC